jgi:hypothetical protein
MILNVQGDARARAQRMGEGNRTGERESVDSSRRWTHAMSHPDPRPYHSAHARHPLASVLCSFRLLPHVHQACEKQELLRLTHVQTSAIARSGSTIWRACSSND